MTYRTLIKLLTPLSSAPEYEASELIRACTQKSREWCMLHRDDELPDVFDDAVAQRKNGVPLQYILGEAWFFGNRFIVSPACLIPQPDTEHCVMLALERMKPDAHILDLCTGSGCIAISILKEKTDAIGAAVDISRDALEIARQNAQLNGVSDRLKIIEADVFSPEIIPFIASADIIVSNPPYINTDVIPTLSPEVQHEPKLALDGGRDGMDFYRHFILNLTAHMRPHASMLLEIGYDQSERILALCGQADVSCRLHRDFGGNIRVAEISRVKSCAAE